MAWPCQAFEHESDHGEADECRDTCRVTFEVARQTAIAADPCECPLDDPSLRQDDEAVKVGAFDDGDLPVAGGGNRPGHFWSLISGVGEYLFDEWKAPSHAPQQVARAIAILDVGGQDAYAKQETERIDEDMTLAPRDLLARIEALRIDRSPPFCAALALCESMTAAVGLALRPAASRAAT